MSSTSGSLLSDLPLARVATSTIGRKAIVAVTGLALVGFVVGHLAGNLLIYKGADAMNQYAYWLKSNPGLLWTARLGLIGVFVVHIAVTLSLNLSSQAARPVDYAYPDRVDTTLTSRTMVVTGLAILAYVLFHLAHLTFGFLYPEHYELTTELVNGSTGQPILNPETGKPEQVHDVYAMTIAGFRVTWVSMTYLLAMVALGFHLTHGIQSVAQTLGFNHDKYTPLIQKISIAVGVGIAVLYATIPISAMTGLIGEGS